MNYRGKTKRMGRNMGRRSNWKKKPVVTLEAGEEVEFFDVTDYDDLKKFQRSKSAMGVKKYEPTSPGRRNMSSSDFASVTASKPFKGLTGVIEQERRT